MQHMWIIETLQSLTNFDFLYTTAECLYKEGLKSAILTPEQQIAEYRHDLINYLIWEDCVSYQEWLKKMQINQICYEKHIPLIWKTCSIVIIGSFLYVVIEQAFYNLI